MPQNEPFYVKIVKYSRFFTSLLIFYVPLILVYYVLNTQFKFPHLSIYMSNISIALCHHELLRVLMYFKQSASPNLAI